MNLPSPLRYPGGKARLAPWLARMIRANGLDRAVYAEPYCGGAGAALWLLDNRHVSRLEINDIDPAIAAFWRSAIYRSDEMIRLIARTRVTLDEWYRQREILARAEQAPELELGFAALFLNRTNHSGIIRGGPIGGVGQAGNWRLDVRFNKSDIIRKVAGLGRMASQIMVHQRDALDFMENVVYGLGAYSLTFIDPPYFHKSSNLYRHLYTPQDHQAVAGVVQDLPFPWMITYDRCPEIRKMYAGIDYLDYSLVSHAGPGFSTSPETVMYGNLMLPSAPPRGRSPGHDGSGDLPAGFPKLRSCGPDAWHSREKR